MPVVDFPSPWFLRGASPCNAACVRLRGSHKLIKSSPPHPHIPLDLAGFPWGRAADAADPTDQRLAARRITRPQTN